MSLKISSLKQGRGGWTINNSGYFVPNDPDNVEAKEVLKWIADGGVVEPEFTAEELREKERATLKQDRDNALNSMTHTFSDGSVVQVRPSDLSNFDIAIAIGQDRDWIMADNTVRFTTVAELEEARNSGIAQGQAIWDDYAQALKAL